MITLRQWAGFAPQRHIELAVTHTFIPSNEHNITPGYYRDSDIVSLLRKYKSDPEAIQFIADMLE